MTQDMPLAQWVAEAVAQLEPLEGNPFVRVGVLAATDRVVVVGHRRHEQPLGLSIAATDEAWKLGSDRPLDADERRWLRA